jgi:hypothetical protein
VGTCEDEGALVLVDPPRSQHCRGQQLAAMMVPALLALAAGASAAGPLVSSGSSSQQQPPQQPPPPPQQQQHQQRRQQQQRRRLLLPAPTNLLVEYLGAGSSNGDVVIGTVRPRFSFLPHPEHAHPGKGVAMASYRIVVSAAGADPAAVTTAWDSGQVNATAAAGIRCGVELVSLTSYTWTASWKAVGVDGPSPTAASKFTIGPSASADWAKSRWVGAGQNEFQIEVTTSNAAAARVFVASPGGAVLRSASTGAHLGSDSIGLSAWVDFRKSVPYLSFPLQQALPVNDTIPTATTNVSSRPVVVTLAIGNGFWSGTYPLGAPFWGIPAGEAAVAQVCHHACCCNALPNSQFARPF